MAMSPRKRARISRGVQYAVLVVIVRGSGADRRLEARSGAVFLDPDVLASMWPEIITTALKNTLLYTICAFTFGLVLGLLLALMRLSPVGPYRWFATAVIEFFRGVPALVVFIAFSIGVPIAFPGREVPGGILGTGDGRSRARRARPTWRRPSAPASRRSRRGRWRPPGRSACLRRRAMISIVVPQAFRIVLPPLTNELILLTKDSSLVYILGLTLEEYELTKFGRDVLNQEKNLTPLVGIALCYLLITIPLSIVVRRMEARAGRAR